MVKSFCVSGSPNPMYRDQFTHNYSEVLLGNTNDLQNEMKCPISVVGSSQLIFATYNLHLVRYGEGHTL